jgi:hypothetical protein
MAIAVSLVMRRQAPTAGNRHVEFATPV